MRKNILLTLTIGLLLSTCVAATAGQNPQPQASTRRPHKQPAGTDQTAGSEPEEQRPAPGTQPRAQTNERTFGKITSVRVDRFEIRKMDRTAQTVMVDDQTQYQDGRGGDQEELQLEDLKPGDEVFVRGRTNDDNEFVAVMVRRVADEEIQHFSSERAFGEITSIDGNEIVVRNPWLGERTIVVNKQTAIVKESQPIILKDLKVGDRIFVLGKETNGQFIAARIVVGRLGEQARPQGEQRTGPENH